jgi:hypothetical protein
MGRNRKYSTPAERQRAYRLRVAGRAPEPVPERRRRPPSRPARLAVLQGAVEALREEYQAWLDSLPDSLHDSDQAARLAETIDQLETVRDLLDDVQPPLGFGRD